MKAIFLAAALTLGTAAIAQDTNSATTANTAGADATQPTATTPPINPNPATDAATSPSTTGSMSTPTTATDPSMAAPAPTSTTADNSASMPSSSMQAPASGGQENYPVCSRKVTDRCIQRGAAARRR